MDSDKVSFALEFTALVAIVISVIAVCGTVVGVAAFKKMEKVSGDTLAAMMERADWTHLVTIMSIVVSIFLLSLFGIVSGEAAVSVLSGVAGYVLGGLRSERARRLKRMSKKAAADQP